MNPDICLPDPIVEDHLFFNDLDNHSFPVPEIEAIMEAPTGLCLAELPRPVVVTPRRKQAHELSPEERIKHISDFYRDRDAFIIQSMTDASAGSTGIQFWSPPRRHVLKVPINWEALVDATPEEIFFALAAHHGEYLDPYLHRRTDEDNIIAKQSWLSYQDIDVETMSWPEQREFRHNRPEEYAQWVEDLKEEMGPHFDESLVLPEWCGPI